MIKWLRSGWGLVLALNMLIVMAFQVTDKYQQKFIVWFWSILILVIVFISWVIIMLGYGY